MFTKTTYKKYFNEKALKPEIINQLPKIIQIESMRYDSYSKKVLVQLLNNKNILFFENNITVNILNEIKNKTQADYLILPQGVISRLNKDFQISTVQNGWVNNYMNLFNKYIVDIVSCDDFSTAILEIKGTLDDNSKYMINYIRRSLCLTINTNGEFLVADLENFTSCPTKINKNSIVPDYLDDLGVNKAEDFKNKIAKTYNNVFKNRNIKLSEISKNTNVTMNTVTYDYDNDEATIHLVTSSNLYEIIIPKTGLFRFKENGVPVNKDKAMKWTGVYAYFTNIPDLSKVNNRIKNYVYFLKNINQFEYFYHIVDSRTNKREHSLFITAKELINILYSDRLESLFAIYNQVPALSQLNQYTEEERFTYLATMFDLKFKNVLVSELKKPISDTVPRINLLFNLNNIVSLTGIRLIQMADTGNGTFNIIRHFNNEQLEHIGYLFYNMLYLIYMLNEKYGKLDVLRLDYVKNKEKALEKSAVHCKALLNDYLYNFFNFSLKYNDLERELNTWINVLELLLLNNAHNEQELFLSLTKNNNLYENYFMKDTIIIYLEINDNKTIEDLYATLLHNRDIGKSLKTFHDELAVMHQALNKKIQQKKYEDIINQYVYQEYKDDKFAIIVPKFLVGIINEGKNLNHCVGSYINRILQKFSFIVFLRKLDALNNSYITIEIKENTITQIAGKNNKLELTNDAPEFKTIKEFAKLNKLKFNIEDYVK